uniref:C1q domain-containing protein n=1 Tax=Maylandia zebra TaxID=106582 RepID=A0A3P9C628_9CICH
MNLNSLFLILLFCEKLNSLEIKMMNIESKLENFSWDKKVKNKAEADVFGLRNTVIFSVGIGVDSPFGPFDTDVTMIYDYTFLNIGNAYSPVTGVFTAPVSGVYFNIFSHSGGRHRTWLHLYKNNEVILHIHDHQSTDTADNGENAAFLQLQQGDTVTVTTFSGFLVKQNS